MQKKFEAAKENFFKSGRKIFYIEEKKYVPDLKKCAVITHVFHKKVLLRLTLIFLD